VSTFIFLHINTGEYTFKYLLQLNLNLNIFQFYLSGLLINTKHQQNREKKNPLRKPNTAKLKMLQATALPSANYRPRPLAPAFNTNISLYFLVWFVFLSFPCSIFIFHVVQSVKSFSV
jgi:hypothetical protein